MRKTVEILGVQVDSITAAEALARAEEYVKTPGLKTIYTPNPEIIMAAWEDPAFRDILNGADMCLPDGIGVVYASRMIHQPVPERVPGFDLTCGLLNSIRKTGEGVYLFGAKPGVAELARANLEKTYPGLQVAGIHDGYFSPADEPGIIADINASGASLLLVCLGAPKQEKWIAAHRNQLTNARLCMGVGGSLDVFAGTVKRAPELFIKLNLEWFYRLCKQPTRLGRMAALPRFMLTVKKVHKK